MLPFFPFFIFFFIAVPAVERRGGEIGISGRRRQVARSKQVGGRDVSAKEVPEGCGRCTAPISTGGGCRGCGDKDEDRNHLATKGGAGIKIHICTARIAV